VFKLALLLSVLLPADKATRVRALGHREKAELFVRWLFTVQLLGLQSQHKPAVPFAAYFQPSCS